MELCRGGELLQRIGKHHYSERTVASYMRAVLRTLAQCHHHRILHRDVKPACRGPDLMPVQPAACTQSAP
ncbi:uncharacterized protein HaLaN_31271, partial [Haematococcus lacustris]